MSSFSSLPNLVFTKYCGSFSCDLVFFLCRDENYGRVVLNRHNSHDALDRWVFQASYIISRNTKAVILREDLFKTDWIFVASLRLSLTFWAREGDSMISSGTSVGWTLCFSSSMFPELQLGGVEKPVLCLRHWRGPPYEKRKEQLQKCDQIRHPWTFGRASLKYRNHSSGVHTLSATVHFFLGTPRLTDTTAWYSMEKQTGKGKLVGKFRQN